jgi:voltage-gated potassium channel
MTSRERFLISLAVLIAICVVSAIGYFIIEPDHGILTAIYMMAITVSTVGYSELYGTSPTVEIWNMISILFGVSTMLVVVGMFTAMLVQGEVGRLMGGRQLESKIKRMNDHLIICGFGRLGRLLAERLAERKVPMVIVERDVSRLKDVERLHQLYVVGDATDEDTLKEAGIDSAQSLVACLANDADNVFVTLTARQMNPKLHLVARADQFSSESKLRRAGADRVISPQTIGAERIANILTRPHVVDFVDVAAKGVELEMEEIKVSEDSPLAGKSLRESDLRRIADVMVVAIKRANGSTRFNPAAEAIMNPGDTLITIGEAGAALRLSQMRLILQSQDQL